MVPAHPGIISQVLQPGPAPGYQFHIGFIAVLAVVWPWQGPADPGYLCTALELGPGLELITWMHIGPFRFQFLGMATPAHPLVI